MNITEKINRETSLEEKREIREARKKEIYTYVLNSHAGVTIKEVIVTLGIPSESVRRIIKSLLEEGMLSAVGKDGKAIVYIDTQRAAVTKEQSDFIITKRDEELKCTGGKEFDVVKPAIHIKQGDIIWVSSRSGDGMFFRYLVITPWEYKAAVLGIFEEGHPKLNINDPYYVYVGKDPEKGVGLYADIRNNCQRGYKQFGERLMHVDDDLMDDVKSRLARSMGISTKKDDANIAELYVTISNLQNELDGAKQHSEDLAKSRYELDEAYKKSVEMREQYKSMYEEMYGAYNALGAEFNKYKEAHEGDNTGAVDDSISDKLNALLWRIDILEKELEGKKEMNDVLKDIIFQSINSNN